MGSAPIRHRYKMSFRQCPNRETIIKTFICAFSSWNEKSIPKASAWGAKPPDSSSRLAPVSLLKLTRMKKFPVSRSSNCALSVMLQPCSAR